MKKKEDLRVAVNQEEQSGSALLNCCAPDCSETNSTEQVNCCDESNTESCCSESTDESCCDSGE